MNAPLVKVEHVSKRFCKSLKRSLWYGLHDIATEVNPFASRAPEFAPQSSAQPTESPQFPQASERCLRQDEFWAVRDVSFELRRGECLGLIGQNGAGKSTLLKMLNGLIKPDEGRIEMRGRVSALIELGAGFNPILTGRENIYNRGAVLGFSRKEIDASFDAIVDFAEIGDFLDMPVQNYSSGMKVRLGFAVSAQMEPDVLIIDEVLAVGDLGFIIKCLNRMAEIIPHAAVILVSHSMPMVARICTQALLMDGGREEYFGRDLPLAIEQYVSKFAAGAKADQGSGEMGISRVGLRGDTESSFVFDDSFVHENGRPLQLRLEYVVNSVPPNDVHLFVLVLDQQLREIVNCVSEESMPPFRFSQEGKATVDVQLPNLYLNRGKHTVTVGAADSRTSKLYCRTTNASTFLVRSKLQGWGTCVIPGQWTRQEQ